MLVDSFGRYDASDQFQPAEVITLRHKNFWSSSSNQKPGERFV